MNIESLHPEKIAKDPHQGSNILELSLQDSNMGNNFGLSNITPSHMMGGGSIY